MSHRNKSLPGDVRLLEDESADPVERASAISRIAADMQYELEHSLANLLHHPSGHLRAEAVMALVGLWELEHYLDEALRILHSDPEWFARTTAATALSMFARYAGTHQGQIIRGLVGGLSQETDPTVQRAIYGNLLELLAPERGQQDLPDDFDRERDVDWDSLKAYLE